MLLFFIILALALLISSKSGSKREIGGGWSFFFSFFFSPLIGYIITSDSPKINGPIVLKEPTTSRKAIAITFILISVFLAFSGVLSLIKYNNSDIEFLKDEYLRAILFAFDLCIGFLGAAAYVSRIKSFRFKGEEISRSEDRSDKKEEANNQKNKNTNP